MLHAAKEYFGVE